MDDDFLYDADIDQEEIDKIKEIQREVLKNQKRNDYIHAENIRVESAIFWDYHYSARAFIMDISEKTWFKKRYNVSTIFLSVLMKDQRVHDRDFERVARELVIAYNAYYNKTPKVSCAPTVGEMRNLYKINELTKDESRAARFFLYVSLKYGYTFTRKIYPHQIQQKIIAVAKGDGGIIEIDDIKEKQFIKYDRESFDDVRFNYTDKRGRQFFESESSDKLYLYIDAEEYGRSSDIENISASISAWKKKKMLDYYVRSEKSSIQVVIRGNAIRRAKSSRELAKRLDKQILHVVNSYSTWIANVKLVDTRELFRTFKHIYVPKSEQVSNGARAIGLWLWDLIHFGKIKQAEATRHILDAPFDHCRKTADERALRRDYALAAKCIKQRAVLKYTS